MIIEASELFVPGYKHQKKGRYEMLLKLLFVAADPKCKVVLKDAIDDKIFFAGLFVDFPYQYADYYVESFNAVGNALVIKISN